MKMFIAVTLLGVTLSSTTFAAEEVKHKLICYVNPLAAYRIGNGAVQIEDFPGNLCTHAIYPALGLDNQTWRERILDPKMDIKQEGFKRFNELKGKFPLLKTLVSVVGILDDGMEFSQMVSVPRRRTTFISSLIEFMQKWNFDGLDIVWENPGGVSSGGQPSDKRNLAAFMGEMRKAFDKQTPDWIISMAVSTVESALESGYDVNKLCRSVNFMNLMAYDFQREYPYADVHSPLRSRGNEIGAAKMFNVESAVKNWADRGCPREKIIVGIPFYGKSFNIGDGNNNYDIGTPVVGPGDVGLVSGTPGLLTFQEVCISYTFLGWTKKYSVPAQAPYAYSGHNWVGFDSKRSVAAKTNFIVQGKYGGAMIWSVDADDTKGTCIATEKYPLATTIHSILSL